MRVTSHRTKLTTVEISKDVLNYINDKMVQFTYARCVDIHNTQMQAHTHTHTTRTHIHTHTQYKEHTASYIHSPGHSSV